MPKERETQLQDIEDIVKSVRNDMDALLVDLKAQVNVAQKRAIKTVSERPMLALGVAFVAGMVVGVALSRSSD
ncbi:MAG: hypothetical protein ABSA92_08030 [Candidatus Bathyarchaeia archaeon]